MVMVEYSNPKHASYIDPLSGCIHSFTSRVASFSMIALIESAIIINLLLAADALERTSIF